MPRKYPWHDFRRPGHYLFTLKAATGCRVRFVTIDAMGVVHDTPLGELIRDQWNKFEKETKGLLKTHAFQLMPDHLHAQVEILTELPHPIGKYIGRFKALATGRARRILDFPQDQALWETAYDWRIKTSREEVEIARAYVNNNPAQHVMKRRANACYGKVAGISHPKLPHFLPDAPAEEPPLEWKGYGNTDLLNGRIWALRVSRQVQSADFCTLIEKALARAHAGDICISPAISPGEKAVFQAVVQAGGKAIHLAATALTPRYHPASWAMEALAAGRFLVLSPLEEGRRHKALSRRVAVQLNACAAAIAEAEAGGGEP